ncbi:Triose phosphate/phosphate translocator TPT, chloroplastic [Tetrabaena socialis]|uniref:Triose phosphate/phosphate translocator TPT, chloroplastic n=1 Tax=Tetrabaena socialis TaxID=47790 RepID=A0A2J7ZMH5_9CHLO|nr:Triose phosphate/phosphate translocator TPT, chloroplastic [Tetrabaena socialis]|eukprot:PNH01462.1 Triose phosphate/phosphate translocator TPT, chloroplastic [Tetrabaena socialis]
MATLSSCRMPVCGNVASRRPAVAPTMLGGLPVRSAQVGAAARLHMVKPIVPVRLSQPVPIRTQAAEEVKELDALETTVSKVVGVKLAPQVVTLTFIAIWYAMNIGFNLLNKTIFKYFPYPYTVSTIHVVVGLVYCVAVYAVGLKSWSFGRAVNKAELKSIVGPAAMHAIGHVAANISFAAVAISLTHTVKTLEPAFNVLLTKVILGESTPLPVLLTLVPIMVGAGLGWFGVALASAGELSFNWTGFLTAMASNLTFGFRAVWSKQAMTKSLDGTAVYAYTTLISVLICVPWALLAEGSTLKAGIEAAIAKVGAQHFYTDLLMVGLLYHLYNQFAFNTLERVSPVSHGVCNVVKRVAIIGSSVFFFNQTLTSQALVGTCIALAGTWLYTDMSAKARKKAAPPPPAGGVTPAAA